MKNLDKEIRKYKTDLEDCKQALKEKNYHMFLIRYGWLLHTEYILNYDYRTEENEVLTKEEIELRSELSFAAWSIDTSIEEHLEKTMERIANK